MLVDRDLLGIVNDWTYESAIEQLSVPKLLVQATEIEGRRHLGGLQPHIHQLQASKELLPMIVDDSFFT